MYKYQTYIASLLLVLFCRIVTPEVALLTLHQHEHSEDTHFSGPVIDEVHQHCHIDEIYNVEFLAPVQFSLEPIHVLELSSYYRLYSFVWQFTFPNNTFLRGPPIK